VAYLHSSVSKDRAKHLRAMLADEFAPTLPAWGALPPPRVPNAIPFDHLRRVLDRL
jgi:hypothetical protein